MSEDVERLLRVFDGRPVREVQDFIAAALLETGFKASELSPAAERMIADFAKRAGVTPGASSEQTVAALHTYFEAHPLDPGLINTFKSALRDGLLTRDPGALASLATRWLGADPKRAPAAEPVEDGVIGRGRRRKRSK